MAKKRGGIAGIYDRNKKVIKALAPIAAGFIPGVGPMIGAGIGAAMGGLDREGKSGIGLDVGGAVKGGLQGYGGAKLGQAAKGGLAKMFTASPLDKLTGAPQVGLTAGGPSSYGTMGSFQPTMAGGAGAAPTAAYTGNVGGYGIGMPLGSAAPVPSSAMTDLPARDISKMIQTTPTGRTPFGNIPAPRMADGSTASLPKLDMASKMQRLTQTTGGAPPTGIPAPRMGAMPRLASQVADKPMGRFAQASKFAKENKDLIEMAGKSIQSVLPDAASDAKYMDAETNRMRLDDEREQMKMEQERRRRMAELLMPMFTQMQQSRQSYGG
jgi:hypothetical protein